MRIALIADIHGHHVALQAVLSDIATQDIDQIICLGDVATLGPQPREVVATLRALNCVCIMGNHEAALLEPEDAVSHQVSPPLLPSLAWSRRQLTASDLDFLAGFQATYSLSIGQAEILCFHGSPTSFTEQILATTSGAALDRMFKGETAHIFVGAHTHIQMMRKFRGKTIVNPGSVGCVFLNPPQANITPYLLPWAEYGILEIDEGVFNIDLRRVSFDMDSFYKRLQACDLPLAGWWLDQYS